MKKTFILIFCGFLCLQTQAFSLRDIFGSNSKGSSTESTTSANPSSTKSNPLGGLLGGSGSSSGGDVLGGILGGVVDNLTGTDNFNIDDIVGTWKYESPAVTFDSDNMLQNLGGSAATSVIEDKLEPYYQQAGFTDLVLKVEPDHSFTMSTKLMSAKGTVEMSETEGLVFNFKAFNKINVGKVKTKASKSLTGLTLTFDVSKLKGAIDQIASLSNNSTLKSLSTMLSSYDGIYAGFKLTKEN